MNATVLTIEYDPNRSAFIALVQYEDGEKRYIIALTDFPSAMLSDREPALISSPEMRLHWQTFL